MKKLLGTALSLALVMSFGPVQAAELFKNLSFKGGLDVSAVSSRNQSDFVTNKANTGAPPAANNDRLGTANTRLWLSGTWDVLDDVHAKTTLRKNDRAWGTNPAGGGQQNAGLGAANGSQSLFATGGTNVAGNIFVDEASVKIDKVAGHADVTVGRQFYGDPGDLIAYWGPKNTYGLWVSAVDALRVDCSHDWVNVTGLAGKWTGSAIGPNTGADVDVRGLDVGVKNLPVKANVFLWNKVTHGTGSLGTPPTNVAAAASGVNDFLWVYGFTVKGEAMGGWAKATVAANSGQNRRQVGVADGLASSANYIGGAFLLDAGYKADIANVGGITPWANWGWGSGRQNTGESHNEQFTAIASDYRPGVIYGRFAGAGAAGEGNSSLALGGAITGFNSQPLSQPGLSNRIIWGVGVKVSPAAVSKLSAGISYWDFSFQRATAAPGASPIAVGNRHIGSEADVELNWAHSENVGVGAGWATFQPGGYIKETIRAASATNQGNSPVNMLFADLNIKF